MANPEEEPTPSASYKTGSGPDLARRMDRMEDWQRTTEKTLSDQGLTIALVAKDVSHMETMNAQRFGSLEKALGSIETMLTAHMKRVEGVISGEIETPQTKQGQAIIAAYEKKRDEVDARLDALEDQKDQTAARIQGRGDVLSWGKVALITLAPVTVAFLAILTFISNHSTP